ncbi:hypothetical protein SAMN05428949_1978 [Chitinophaga sp. YR627]|uniref:hypothetical protein n=1 Tax=Chitinophaga sp. YR627 TaxID=1881041 RepID=UPI0008E86186|nr:hypothetical protein [Chitinophaga sp. YR627]SFN21819.1 hypothetical protein SAMN05428949_1978 [Chitinophaga sp. YR627]
MKVGINQNVSPIRMGIYIVPESEESFKEAIEIGFSYWGGLFSPILPFYEELSAEYRKEFEINIPTLEFYENCIDNYDVDIVVYDGTLDKSMVEKYAKDRPIVSFTEYVNQSKISLDHFGINITHIGDHLADKEFKFVRNDKTKFAIPEIEKDNLFFKTWLCSLPSNIEDHLCATFTQCSSLIKPAVTWDNIVAYREQRAPDPLLLNMYMLKGIKKQWLPGRRIVYFFQSKRLQDLMNFWNLRAAGWIVKPMPVDSPNNELHYTFLTELYEEEINDKRKSDIISVQSLNGYTCTSEEISKIKEGFFKSKPELQKAALFGFQDWFPRFWEKYELSAADGIKSASLVSVSHYDQYDTVDGSVFLAPQELPFEIHGNGNDRSSFKLSADVHLFDNYSEYAGLITDLPVKKFRSLTTEIMSLPHWRVSAGIYHKHVYARKIDKDVEFVPVKAIDFFTYYFDSKGYHLKETVNSKLAKEVYKNIGGRYGSYFFSQKERLKIVEFFEGGVQVKHSTLAGEIHKQLGDGKYIDGFIKRLLEYKIIEFGTVINCKICEQEGFYLPEHFHNKLTCPMCRNEFMLPTGTPKDIHFAYRGIGPFARKNKAQGVMAVFAALRLFINEIVDEDKVTALYGFELIKKGKHQENPAEVDLCLLVQNKYNHYKKPDLVFFECKTYVPFKEIDIARMKSLGDEFPGAILVFVTLNNELSPEEIALISGLVKHFQTGRDQRPRNPVLILTANELLAKDAMAALDEYEKQMHSSQSYNDYLGALCELSVRRYLKIMNWWDLDRYHRTLECARRQNIGAIVESVSAHIKAKDSSLK